jgi:hypothetical protein
MPPLDLSQKQLVFLPSFLKTLLIVLQHIENFLFNTNPYELEMVFGSQMNTCHGALEFLPIGS